MPPAAPDVVESRRGAEPRPRLLPREGAYWLLIAAGLFLTGWLKGINLILLLAYVMLFVWAGNWLVARRELHRLRGRRLPPGPVFAGTPAAWEVEVSNPSPKPVTGCMVEDRGPGHDLGWFVVRLGGGETLRLGRSVTLPRRGRYRLEPLLAWTRYPFGLAHRSAELAPGGELIVLPKLGRVQAERLRQWLAKMGRGDARPLRRTRRDARHEADFHGLRPFRFGDSPRWIHWRSSARRDELMVREFEAAAPPHLLLIVEPWLPEKPTKADREGLEAVIRLAATVCREWCREPAARLALVLARPEGAVVPPGGGAEHGLRALEALAVEEGGPAAGPGGWLERLGRGSTAMPVLVLSSRPDGTLADELVRLLGRPVPRVAAGEEVAWYQEGE